MTPPLSQDPPRPSDANARRSKRVNLAIPIILRGTDDSGNEFQESTRTTVVSKHGAKIRTSQTLGLGATVTIENRSLGLAANATVVSVSKRQSPTDQAEIGVQLTQAGNVWGIIFPPDDWQAEPLPALDGGEQNAAPKPAEPSASETRNSSPATGSTEPVRSVPGQVSGRDTLTSTAAEPVVAKTGSTVLPAPASVAGAPRDRIDAIAAAVLAKLTKQLDEAAEARLKDYSEKVIRFTNQFALRVQANFQEAANRTEDQMVVLIQQKLGGLADRVQASRTFLESLLTKFESLQKNSRALVEDTDQKIREASHLALESALQELTVNLRKGVEGTTVTLEAECQELVLDAVTKTVNATLARADEQLAVQTKDRLSKSYAELKWQHEQMIDGVKDQLNQIALAGTTNLSSKFETMAADLVPSLRAEMEKSLQDSAGKVVTQTAQSLHDQAHVLTQDTLVSLQQTVQVLQDRMQEESRKVRQSTEQEAAKTGEAFSQSVTQRTDLALEAVQSATEQSAAKLRSAQLEAARSLRAGVDDYQRQLTTRSGLALEGYQSGLQNITREMQEGASQLFSQKLQCTAEELAETSAEKVRQHIQESATEAAETLSKESNKRLAMMADEFFLTSSKELQERLRVQAEAQLEAVIQSAPDKFSERLNKLTQEAGLTLIKVTGTELQKLARALLQSNSETLRKEVEQLAGNLQNDLKAFQSTLADQAKKQLLGMARSTVETLNREATAGLEEFQTRLHKAAQESNEESLRELESSFQEAFEKQRAAISVLLQQQAEQSRDLAGLQIKTMSEQIVAKAADALDRQASKSARTVADAGEQARASAENHVQRIATEAENSIGEYQRQIEQANSAALDKFRQDTGILLEEVVFRLQQSVRSFQSSTGSEVLSELQKASDNLLEVSAAQMRKQTEQTLELITERLKAKEEEVVSDAANIFRSRIAEIFSILQASPKKTADLQDAEQIKKED